MRANHGDDGKARAYVTALFKNVPVLDSGARGATTSFTERGLGDVLLAWENEAFYAQREKPGAFDVIAPRTSILAEPPVAWIDVNVQKHDTAKLAKAYLEYLYAPEAQKLACKFGYRPRLTKILGSCGSHFAQMDLSTIRNFGGWDAAQKRFFGDGGVFDQIYQR